MELWSGRDDLHPLARSFGSPTGLSHHDRCSYGSRVYQIFARMDGMGGACRYQYLG